MKNHLIYLFAPLLLTACDTTIPPPPTEENSIAVTAEESLESTTRGTEHICYKLMEGPDMTELSLTIENDSKVTGIYNWIPSEKDAKMGNLSGTLVEGTIKATYTFMQEGEEGKEELTIVLGPESVQISDLETALPLIDCPKE